MKYLLDTDTISYYTKAHPIVTAKLDLMSGDDICISVVSTMEVEYGFAINPVARQRYDGAFQRLLHEAYLIEFSSVDALFTAKIRAELHPQQLGRYDALLAGVAIARDLILVTNNTKHFSRIRGLKLENWTQM